MSVFIQVKLSVLCSGTVLCIGMEYQRTNNLPLAEQFFLQAYLICPTDPLVYNELGVLYFRTKVSAACVMLPFMSVRSLWRSQQSCARQDYGEAERYLLGAIKLIQTPLSEAWEAAVVRSLENGVLFSVLRVSVEPCRGNSR